MGSISEQILIFVSVLVALFGLSELYFSSSSAAYVNCTSWDGLSDKDCDQIADQWEKNGKNGLTLYDSTYQANENVKDIYLEIDYRGHHKPLSGVKAALEIAFLNSGVPNVLGHPSGIKLHIFENENMGNPANDPCTDMATFSNIKNAWFGFSPAERANAPLMAAKRSIFHYGIFVHSQCSAPTSSGASEIGGNDLVVSLGSFTGGVGSLTQQQGTLMHELGHNLGLRHGGDVSVNCKPDYLSVMNWAFQFPLYTTPPPTGPNRFPDFSKSEWNRPDGLNENSLIESVGIGPLNFQTAIGGGAPPTLINAFVPTGVAIDYNRNSRTSDTVSRNLNNFGYPSPISEDRCNSASASPVPLKGYKDWDDRLKYWGAGGGWSSGAPAVNGSGTPVILTSNKLQAEDNLAYAINGGVQASNQSFQQGTVPFNNSSQSLPDEAGNFSNDTEITIEIVRIARLQVLQYIDSQIQSLPDSAFAPAANTSRAYFHNELLGINNSIANITQSDKLGDAIDRLVKLRETMDGNFGGSPKDDLIVDAQAQAVIVSLVDNFTQILVQQR